MDAQDSDRLSQDIATSRRELHNAVPGDLVIFTGGGFTLPAKSQILKINPAAAVKAAKHIVKKGKTAVLKADEARQFLDAIGIPTLIGLPDRALIGVMIYSFARVGAALGLKVMDYYTEGRKAWFRLYEKCDKRHEVPARPNAAD